MKGKSSYPVQNSRYLQSAIAATQVHYNNCRQPADDSMANPWTESVCHQLHKYLCATKLAHHMKNSHKNDKSDTHADYDHRRDLETRGVISVVVH